MDVAELTLAWAAIPSITGQERELLHRVEADLADLGWRTRRIPVDHERYDILAGPPHGQVLLTTHLDTVPPHIPPWREGDTLHGRGVVDAKGVAAAMLAAACELRHRGVEVSVLYVVGEETDSDGALAAVEAGLRFPYVINGEPTQNTLASSQKGTVRVTLRTTGIPCHSGYPQEGLSATHTLVQVLADLLATPWPTSGDLGDTTLNIGSIRGGVADNVTAPDAEARLMFRTTVPSQEVVERVHAVVGGRASVDPGKVSEPFRLFVPPGFSSAPVAFGSDAPVLSRIGRVIMGGPGSILVAHGPQERIRTEELWEGVSLYVAVAATLCGGDP